MREGVNACKRMNKKTAKCQNVRRRHSYESYSFFAWLAGCQRWLTYACRLAPIESAFNFVLLSRE